jgi:hypothetical protein
MPTGESKAFPFQVMAGRITHNADATFGGAVVIIPPGDGKPIELLMLDAQGDEGQFWATILTRIQVAISENDQKKQVSRTFGVR